MPRLIDPFKLPSLKLSQLKELPPCVAIYFAIDEEQRVLYVGKTKNLNERWSNTHHRMKQLQKMDKDSPVAIAWNPWNTEGLDEAEKYFISTFQPLLNGTKVMSPEIIPSEVILRDFLTTFSKKLIILGINQAQLPEVILKYKWAKPLSDVDKIKEFIKESNKKNTSLKFRWKRYINIRHGDIARPGSRLQKFRARRNNAYNNHWQLACNGVKLHITPAGGGYHDSDFGSYQELKAQSKPKELAGIKIRAVTPGNLAGMGYQDEYFFSNLSCYEDDIVPLLWS